MSWGFSLISLSEVSMPAGRQTQLRRPEQRVVAHLTEHEVMGRRQAYRLDGSADKRLHAHRAVADGDRLDLADVEALGLEHFFGDQLIRAFDRRHADFLASELLHIFD